MMQLIIALNNLEDNIINKAIEEASLLKPAQLWVKGLNFNWDKLYEKTKSIYEYSLPGYPFARKRHWIENKNEEPGNRGLKKLHPLLHENTSSIEKQCFTSVFTGEEPFLRDHVIKGRKVLPASAYMEMARAAIEKASVACGQAVLLEDMVWQQPFIADDGPKEINISLYPEDDGSMEYIVYGNSGASKEEIIYCRGTGRITNKSKEAERIDMESVRKRIWEENNPGRVL